MSEAKNKVAALARKFEELRVRATMDPDEGTAERQAKRLVAAFMLDQFRLEAVHDHLVKAADWEPITPEQAAQEAEVENSLTATIERYSASQRGRPQPIYSRAAFAQAWEVGTGTTGDAIDPYFAGLITYMLPVAESLLQRVEELLVEADSETAG